MATASSFLSDDQFQCSICLDVFTEPVSVPCGHNFCKACIDRHWEGKEQCQCPLCNEKFNKGLKLRVNTEFREVVENFKKHHVNNSPVKPGQVPCDCCVGNKFKAAKTCLVCLTSYCEKHLEPHQRVAALKRHKLTNPVHNLDDKTCKKHNRILELFCRNDLTRVCVLCTEHSAHDVVPLEEPYVDKRALMGKEKAVAQEIKPKHGKKAKKMKVAEQTKRKGKNEAVTNCVACMRDPHIWLFEVEAEGRTGWDLGIVRESNLRKRTFTPSPRNGNWIIRFENNTTCHALDDVPVHLFLLSKPKRVLVFLDYDDGLVSFCDADTAVLIYTFTGCKFGERIFLYYRPTDDVSWAQTLRKKVQKMKVWSQLGYILLGISICLILTWQH